MGRGGLGQGGGNGGGDLWHLGDVVPEVRVGVAARQVEHGGRRDHGAVPAVGAEQGAHEGVVARTVLDDHLGLGQVGRVCASVSKRWGSALGFVMREVTETSRPPIAP